MLARSINASNKYWDDIINQDTIDTEYSFQVALCGLFIIELSMPEA